MYNPGRGTRSYLKTSVALTLPKPPLREEFVFGRSLTNDSSLTLMDRGAVCREHQWAYCGVVVTKIIPKGHIWYTVSDHQHEVEAILASVENTRKHIALRRSHV